MLSSRLRVLPHLLLDTSDPFVSIFFFGFTAAIRIFLHRILPFVLPFDVTPRQRPSSLKAQMRPYHLPSSSLGLFVIAAVFSDAS